MKQCKRCGETKPLAAYHFVKANSDGRSGSCRLCVNNKNRGWYDKTRRRRQDAANGRNQRVKQEMVDRFGGRCGDCKNSYPNCVYEFHHLDPASKDVNPSKALTWTKDRRERELAKCIMLCSNCHKIRHFVKPDMTSRLED